MFLQRSFFTGIVGGQSELAARGARTMANEAGSQLLTAVSDFTLADVLEREGKKDEARSWYQRGLWCARGLPEGAKTSMGITLPPAERPVKLKETGGPAE